MSVSGILKKLYPMDREKRYPMDLSKRVRRFVGAGGHFTIGLEPDGTCVVAGKYQGNAGYYPLPVSKLNGVITISAGYRTVIGLKPDGTYTLIGYSSYEWKNLAALNGSIAIVPIGNTAENVIGLKPDGTCVVADIFQDISSATRWTDIVSISGGSYCAIGLKSDGTCDSVGTTLNYPAGGRDNFNVSSWTDIVATSVGLVHAVGLKSDGTCVVEYLFKKGDVNAYSPNGFATRMNAILQWTNIVDVVAGQGYTLGLKSDGTCVIASIYNNGEMDSVSEWTDIVAISGSEFHVVGLKSDGTCVTAGYKYDYNQEAFNVADWHLMQYFRQGILTSKTPVNLLNKTSVSGFTVKGIEPANTKRRVAFKVEDKWNKLSAEGALTPLATQEITADSVLEEGNTVAELEAITATTGLAGKLIYPAVALYADPEAEVMPTFGMTVNAEIDTTVNVYSYTGYSQEYSLSAGEDVQVVNVVAETETTGEGNVVVTARLKQGGEWTDYMALSDTAMKQASALQLKAVYTVTNTDGSQSAKVKNVTIRYTTSGATVNGVSTDIVTKTQRFTNDLVYAHCYVKHKKLQDAVIDAYCSLRKRPKSKSMYQFGNGTGALNTYKLPDAGINQDTLSVYVDGKAVYDFGYNTETSEITLTADKDTALSASYECGWEMSEWIKMVQGVSQVNDGGGYTTEYSYTVPTHEGYEYTVTAIKYSLVRPEGTVTEETIGVGTGKRQMIELPHFAKKETIVCNCAWSYDYDRKLLTIIAPEGEDIVISYDWIAETPTVYAVSAGWAD